MIDSPEAGPHVERHDVGCQGGNRQVRGRERYMNPPLNASGERDRGARLCLVGTILFTVLMLYLTHIPNPKVPAWIVRIGDDKFRHVMAYGIWACLALGATRGWCPRRGCAVAGVLLAAAVISAADEITQPWFGRTCSFWDFSASVLGAMVGCSLMLAWESFWKRDSGPGVAPERPGKHPNSAEPARAVHAETPETRLS